MSKCKECGGEKPPSRGYKPRQFCKPACRVAFARRTKPEKPKQAHPKPVAVARIKPGDARLVDRVTALVAEQLDCDDDVAGAQGALAVALAGMAAEGSVSACRELRLLLLERRCCVGRKRDTKQAPREADGVCEPDGTAEVTLHESPI